MAQRGLRSDELSARYQRLRARVFEEVVSPEAWKEVVEAALEKAREGDLAAMKLLLPWAMPKPLARASASRQRRDPLRIVIPELPDGEDVERSAVAKAAAAMGLPGKGAGPPMGEKDT